MTKIKLIAPVKEMNGEFEKGSGIVMRKKKYRAPNGAILKEGTQESYKNETAMMTCQNDIADYPKCFAK